MPHHLDLVVTWLWLPLPPLVAFPPERPPGFTIERATRITVSDYRHMFARVGEPWLWHGRTVMPDRALADWLARPETQILFPMHQGKQAGLAEINRLPNGVCRLAYFGLAPDYLGQGLGRCFLRTVIDHCLLDGSLIVTVNTCTFDHPAALKTYLACGFRISCTRYLRIKDPRLNGILPPTSGPHIPLADRNATIGTREGR